MPKLQAIPVLCLALAACAAPRDAAPAPDIDFVRGCWVEKTEPGGPITAFLRLLPDRDAGQTLAGPIQDVQHHAGDAAMKTRATLAFTRDGKRVDIVFPDGLHASLHAATGTPPHSGEAAFTADGLRLRATALPGDELLITWTGRDSVESDLFRGERDGCD